RDALAEAPVRDPARSLGEAAEVADDRASLQVGDDADERQAREQPAEEPVADTCVGRVDQYLPGQDGEPRSRDSWQPRRDECAIGRARDADGRALPGRNVDLSAQERRGGRDPLALEEDE